MLLEQVREQMKNQRIELYERRIFDLQMDFAALEANGDKMGCKEIQKRIEAIQKAIEAVRRL